MCPNYDNPGAELNPTAGAELYHPLVGHGTVVIKVSEDDGVTMKVGELKQ